MRPEWILGPAIGLAFAIPAPIRHGRDEAPGAPPSRFLALGDSYTIGEKVDSVDRWPVQLARMLRARKIDIADPEIIARTGWTTDELAAGMLIASPVGPYDLVTLLIGVNNQFRGRDPERYRAEFKSLLAQATELAGGRAGHVVVLSIPDWGVTPFATGRDRPKIGAEVDRFNAINREETLRGGARYVDVTPTSREEHEGWTAGDGLHPGGEQYKRWAQLAVDAAVTALRGK